MTVLRDPMSEHGAIADFADECGGWAMAAASLGMTEKGLRNASNPYGDGKGPTLKYRDVLAATATGKVAFAQQLALSCGMTLVPLTGEAQVRCLIGRSAVLMREVGQVATAIADAVSDQQVTANEAVTIRQELMDVVREAQGILNVLGHSGEVVK